MKTFTKHKRTTLVAALLLCGVFILSQCVEPETEAGPPVADESFSEFAGSESCAGCHKEVYEDHLKTAHFLTSQPASEKYVKGSFEPGKNSFAFNKSVVVSMEKRADGFYQVEYYKDEEKRAERMDIVVGSGTMGQSSLYWRDHYLFQLPITYFHAADQWSNSPGFPDKVVFNRIITSRCLECHATYAKPFSEPDQELEKFDRNRIIYGVDCEKCHGAAAQHVRFHGENKSDTVGRHIVNPSTFNRQQQLDLCALCHGGRLQKTQPSFTFTSGKSLSDFFVVDSSMPDPNNIDVHGNQYGLMRASKCFKGSDVMTCNSCHDVHKNERGQMKVFSERCINCHSQQHVGFCPMEKTIGKSIVDNCVDCHMPEKPSRAIAVFLPGAEHPTAAQIRSHYIAVYPEEAERILRAIRESRTDNRQSTIEKGE